GRDDALPGARVLRPRARRPDLRADPGPPRAQRGRPRHQHGSDRRRHRLGRRGRARRRRAQARGGGVRLRPRHRHPVQRPRREPGPAPAAAAPRRRRPAAARLQQAHLRPHLRHGRNHQRRRHLADAPPPAAGPDRQPPHAGPRVRPRPRRRGAPRHRVRPGGLAVLRLRLADLRHGPGARMTTTPEHPAATGHRTGPYLAADPDDLIRRFVREGEHLHAAATMSRPNALLNAVCRTFAGSRSLNVSTTAVHSSAHALALPGAVRKVITGFVGDTYPSPRPNRLYRELAEGRPFEIEMWSLLTYTQRLIAAALGQPFATTGSRLAETD